MQCVAGCFCQAGYVRVERNGPCSPVEMCNENTGKDNTKKHSGFKYFYLIIGKFSGDLNRPHLYEYCDSGEASFGPCLKDARNPCLNGGKCLRQSDGLDKCCPSMQEGDK